MLCGSISHRLGAFKGLVLIVKVLRRVFVELQKSGESFAHFVLSAGSKLNDVRFSFRDEVFVT